MEHQAEQREQRGEQPRVRGRPFPKGVSGNPQGRRAGSAKAAAAADEAERRAVAAELIRDLGRSPSAVERLLIDELAALAVRGRKLRSRGEASDDVARLMARIAGKLGFRPAQPPKVESYAELSARIAATAAARRAAKLAGDVDTPTDTDEGASVASKGAPLAHAASPSGGDAS